MKVGWKTKPLGAICVFSNGLWTGKKPPFEEATVIRNTNFRPHGRLDHSDVALLNVETRQLAKRRLQHGDIIIEKSGGGPKQPVGRVAFFDKADGIYSFSNFTSSARVLDRSEVDPEYLIRFLDWCYVSGVTAGMQSHSTGIRNLDFNAYKTIEIPLPHLEEQRRIVAVLDEAFAAIATATANAEKNLANARELFESYCEAQFAQIIRENVTAVALGDLTASGSGITYGVVKPGGEGSVAFVRGGDLVNGQVRMTKLRTITKDFSEQYRRTLLLGGELLICLVGTPGECAIAPKELAGANIARQVGMIRLRNEISSEYVRDYLLSRVGQKALGLKTGGSVQQVINLGDLKLIEIPIPDISIQLDIVEKARHMKCSTSKLEYHYREKIAQISNLKKSLLHRAFTGELTATAPKTIAA